MNKFWDKKNRLRKHLPLTNRTLFVIEKLGEQKKKPLGEIIEEMLCDSTIYQRMAGELRRDFPDLGGKIDAK